MKDLLIIGGLIAGALYYEYEVKPSSSIIALAPKEEEESSCPDGYTLSADGTQCVPNEDISATEDEGTKELSTADKLLNIAKLAGIYGGSLVVEKVIRKALTPSEAKLKAEADAKLKAEADAKIKAEADLEAKNKLKAEADLKIKNQAEVDKMKLSTKPDPVITKANNLADSEVIAKKTASELRASTEATRLAKIAEANKAVAKATKLSKLSKLGKLAKTTPWGFLFTALTMTLSATLDLDPEDFNPCADGEFDVNSLPDWAKIIISQVPFVGDLMDLMGYLLCVSNKCNSNEEEGHIGTVPTSICYEPCRAGYKSDGVNLCYKQYPDFENNGSLHTITSITKRIILDTGKPVSTCGADEDSDAGLCYKKCPNGYKGVGPVCWKQTHGIGVGTPVLLEDCPIGWNNDGLTCREPLTWNDHCVYWGFGNWSGCLGGGNVVGRLNNGGKCDDGKEKIDGLCYNKCNAGEEHVAGMPYLCGPVGPLSQVRGVGKPMGCKDGETNIAGLCYGAIPEGYSRQSLGLLSQNCPAGTNDFGVGCTRESYGRGVGRPKIMISVKSRKLFRNFVERAKDFGSAINPF